MNISSNCNHQNKLAIPDSAATVCKECGQVFVYGKPWEYKSGHISDWLNDFYEYSTSETTYE